jgi:predicted O-methyltransferase YrrM
VTPERGLALGSALPTRLWPEGAGRNPLKRLARQILHRLARTGGGRRAIQVLLKDEKTLTFVFQHVSNRLSARASFARDAPNGVEIRGFEDCVWIFSSSQLNHGLSRLSISEAAYLYRLIRSLPSPATLEIGRFRGGSTFLFALAGARVLSIDLDSRRQRADDEALLEALAGFGMRERVELALANSHAYPVGGRRLDVCFIDGDHRYEGVRADFEHWWPAIAPGGHVLFHDAFPGLPLSDGVVQLVGQIRQRDDAVEVPKAPDTLVHFVKQLHHKATNDA